LICSLAGRLLAAPADTTVSALRLIGEYDVPFNHPFASTTIGGLSGIDYDPASGLYYLISDDRSAINPARFYVARIKTSDKGIDTVEFVAVHTILQPDGQTFPSIKADHSRTVDPESIRYNPKTGQLFWSSEGERSIRPDGNVLTNPGIYLATGEGRAAGSLAMPDQLTMRSTEAGPRQNGTLEGLAFADGFKTLYASLEEPRYEDGPKADVVATRSWIRIYQFDVATKKAIAAYAYPLDPVAFPAIPAGAFKVNGVSEILSLGKQKLLTIERSFSTGMLACTVKIFVTDLRGAENILGKVSLTTSPPSPAATKRLVLNMNDLKLFIDNIEGVTFGPDLPNGHHTLLFVSDNNFSPLEKMQFLWFEVMP